MIGLDDVVAVAGMLAVWVRSRNCLVVGKIAVVAEAVVDVAAAVGVADTAATDAARTGCSRVLARLARRRVLSAVETRADRIERRRSRRVPAPRLRSAYPAAVGVVAVVLGWMRGRQRTDTALATLRVGARKAAGVVELVVVVAANLVVSCRMALGHSEAVAGIANGHVIWGWPCRSDSGLRLRYVVEHMVVLKMMVGSHQEGRMAVGLTVAEDVRMGFVMGAATLMLRVDSRSRGAL